MASERKSPWERPARKKKKRSTRKLQPKQKAAAKRRAKKAGRPYPNLVDNMREAATGRKKKRGSGKRKKKR